MVPRIHIAKKEVIYRSEIYFTPLRSQTEIDMNGIKAIIRKEYELAGFSPGELDTGAVMITGETARKENANLVLHALSEWAGDFVVATAGPDLEGVLAAKGAGSDKISEEERSVIVNLDIGGGTTNIAKYQKGHLIGTSCLNIGGRLIKIEKGRISYVFPGIEQLARPHGIFVEVGEPAKSEKLYRVCQLMAHQLAMALNLCSPDSFHDQMYTNQGKPLPKEPVLDGITYSGGVADCMIKEANPPTKVDGVRKGAESPLETGCMKSSAEFSTEALGTFTSESVEEMYPYGDIGRLLAKAILSNKDLQRVKTYRTQETIRATVVGAGTHTTHVSGSTIRYNKENLPLKNLPVIKIAQEDEKHKTGFIKAINQGLSFHEKEEEMDPIAIAFSGEFHTTFDQIQELARWILEGARNLIDSTHPLILVVEQDIAKALGNALKVLLEKNKELICIDGVCVNDGDYMDIGEPVAGGLAVPVITKTLIFNT